MKKIILIAVVILLFAGCSKEQVKDTLESQNAIDPSVTAAAVNGNVNTDVKPTQTSDGTVGDGQVKDYPFVYNDVTIHMNTDVAPTLKALGDSMDYFEAPSCAFQGLDKIYYYSGFELYTYPKEGKDVIASVNLVDDSVSTVEGIGIGSTLDEVLAAYGKGYTQDVEAYTYTLGESKLTFVIEDNTVTAVTYMADVEGLQLQQ